eukprot:gene641-8144_t
MNFPIERQFLQVSKIQNSKRILRVLQYNVLNPKNLYRDQFPWASKKCLKWSYRKPNLLKEIQSANPDIFTLQECSFFDEFWKPEFTKLGYEGYYKEQKNSGVSIFLKKELNKEFDLKIIEKVEVNFNELHDLFEEEDKIERFKMNNVALILVAQYVHKETKEEFNFIVATTHLYWSCDYYIVRMLQMAKLGKTINELKYKYPVIMAGDFNYTPDDIEYEYFTGCFEVDDGSKILTKVKERDFTNKEFIEKYLKQIQVVGKLLENMKIPKFKSSYSEYTKLIKSDHKNMDLYVGEPPYTVHAGISICLDYIYYLGDELKVRNILKIPDEEAFDQGIPNDQFSSDHISLMTEFEF